MSRSTNSNQINGNENNVEIRYTHRVYQVVSVVLIRLVLRPDPSSYKIKKREKACRQGINIYWTSNERNAPVSGMPHHPYMGIMWGDGRGFAR